MREAASRHRSRLASRREPTNFEKIQRAHKLHYTLNLITTLFHTWCPDSFELLRPLHQVREEKRPHDQAACGAAEVQSSEQGHCATTAHAAAMIKSLFRSLEVLLLGSS